MQLPIYNIAELMDQTYSIINAVLTKHLKSDKSVVEKLKNYITGDDSNMSFGTVSMTEVHVVLDKVVDLLIRENKNNEAHCLIFEIGSLISDLKDLVPDKNKLKLTIRKIDALNEKIEKRI
jgi:hypothetical protein